MRHKHFLDDAFMGGREVSKKRTHGWLVVVAVVGIWIGGASIWLVWQDQATTDNVSRASTDKTEISGSDNLDTINYVDDSQVMRNDRFKQYTGMTMDEYLRKPRPIEGVNEQYQAMRILESSNRYEEAAKVGRTLYDYGEIPTGIIPREFYIQLFSIAEKAGDDELYEYAFKSFVKSVMENEKLPESVKRQTIDLYS